MQTIYTFLTSLCILLLSAVPASSQCIQDAHSPFEEQGWLSCRTILSPNNIRGVAHWVHYDLGYSYPVKAFHFWNHNVWGETSMGVKKMVVDYSMDNISWSVLDTFDVEMAPGSWRYTGVDIPEFDEVEGQYFLFTVLETWDGLESCAGVAEIKFILGEVSTSTSDPTVSFDFKLSPNPAADFIRLEWPSSEKPEQVDVYSTVGQKLAAFSDPSADQLTISVSGYKPGMYYVRLYTNGEVYSKSFVKME